MIVSLKICLTGSGMMKATTSQENAEKIINAWKELSPEKSCKSVWQITKGNCKYVFDLVQVAAVYYEPNEET